jgi:hypothetical protein
MRHAPARHCDFELPLNEPSFKPKDAIAQAVEIAISARIGSLPLSMMAAIHFHDEPHRRSDEVGNVPSERDLPTEPNPEPAATKLRPELLLGRRESRAHLTRARLDEFARLRLRERMTQESLLGPGCGRASPQPAQDP